ncbi:hypothetical protein Y032_0530g3004 [Ancylostoma ceylanicum]|uniref:Uncharacterized protein n=1 Tax=Ancylostoma ceylanicum TaxID=53326 RepID=A0A016WTA9_9BILA|nr:hypothetical protein Y032_0530g3004 [Ancylostoma ceylanicum]
MIDRLLLCILTLCTIKSAICCQPPPPAYQHDPQPMMRPVAVPDVAAPPPVPAQPQIAFPMGNAITEDAPNPLRMGPLNNGVAQHNAIDGPVISIQRHREFAPYPGYIPPPPEVPTQHNAGQTTSPVGPPVFAHLNDVRSSAVGSVSSDQKPFCPVELHVLRDFAACVQPVTFSPSNEKSTSCDFEDGTFCRFQPTSSLFQMGKLPLPSHYASIAELSGRSVLFQPEGNFVYVLSQYMLSEDEEVALSAPITCQRGNGILNFNYWLIGDRTATVKVCTQDSQSRSCTKPIIYTDSSLVSVEVVHPQAEVFDIEIVTSNLSQPTLFILDNLSYKSELCDGSSKQNDADSTHPSEEQVKEFFDDDGNNDGEAQVNGDAVQAENSVSEQTAQQRQSHREEEPQPKRSPVKIKNVAACRLLACTFTTSMCEYKNYENRSMSLVEWKLGNHRVGNIHTGIKDQDDNADGGFLFVGTDSSTLGLTTYILESPKFSLDEDAHLVFDVYRRSKDITLQICMDSPFHCPYSVSPFDKRVHWKQGETFVIPQKTTKIFFKAIQWRKFKWLAIDNIRLGGCPQL